MSSIFAIEVCPAVDQLPSAAPAVRVLNHTYSEKEISDVTHIPVCRADDFMYPYREGSGCVSDLIDLMSQRCAGEKKEHFRNSIHFSEVK
jgi:hypothetical protein